MRMSQIWKLYITYTVVLVVCMAGAGLALQGVLRATLTDQLQDEVRTLILVIARAVPPEDTPASLDPFCRAYQKSTGNRITVIRRDGLVIGESNRPSDALDNHTDRPEFKAALEHGWATAIRRSGTLGLEMLYMAHLLGDGNRVLRLAVPMEKVKAMENNIMLLLSIVLYLAPLLAVVVSFFMARRLTV